VYGNLCDVPGVRVGHATDTEGLTGCTVVLFDRPVVGGVDVRGSSPGTRETDLLDPVAKVEEVHAFLLTGGSAFGLAAADGVMRYLEEQDVGYDTYIARVPLVPSAVIFDLAIGSAQACPDGQMGYAAASSAISGDFEQGNAGVGTGATVGKTLGIERAMKSGVGSVSIERGELVIGALAAVNPVGDVRNTAGRIVAGPRLRDGSFGDSVGLLAEAAGRVRRGENTTLAVVATNARLTKSGVNKVACMAQDGLARAVHPAHTTFDGDTVFAATTGGVEAPLDLVGAYAARTVQESIVRAARSSRSAGGVPGLAN
jgi:L-aminopeptidase/D-esterase-like protein